MAVCITVYEPGGQSVVVDEQIRHLSDRYDFTIVTEAVRKAPPAGVRIVICKPWRSRFLPFSERAFHQLLGTFDLVHCHDSFAQIWESTKLDIPVIVTSHGNCPGEYRDTLRSKAEYYMSEPLYGLAYRRANRVVAISRSIQSWLKERYDIESSLCFNGVDLERFSLNTKARESAFFYAGQLSARKGLPALLSAFAAFRDRHPEFTLWLSGFGDMAAEVSGDSARGIEFFGFVSSERLVELFSNATAVVSASHWEGFGLPILEAFACGTPVVFRRGYAMTEFVENTGCGVLFDEDADIGAALESVLDLPQSPQRARDVAEQYSWGRNADCLNDIYCDELRKSGRTTGQYI